uniref:Secreted protein n=1 Tax=Panagrellus redivivus TaxID=6233 RepID=A0A7E4W2U7_PANRE
MCNKMFALVFLALFGVGIFVQQSSAALQLPNSYLYPNDQLFMLRFPESKRFRTGKTTLQTLLQKHPSSSKYDRRNTTMSFPVNDKHHQKANLNISAYRH